MKISKQSTIAGLIFSALLCIGVFQNCSVPLGSATTYVDGGATSASTSSGASGSSGVVAVATPIISTSTPLPVTTSTGSVTGNVTAGVCKNPDSGSTMANGAVYGFYTIPSGTSADCMSSLKNSFCEFDGLVVPQVPAIHYTSCQIVAVVTTTGGAPTPTPAPVSSGGATTSPTATPTPVPTATPNTMTTTTAPAGCAGAAICDSFETVAAGGAPDTSVWSLLSPDCSGAGKISVDATQAHTGKQSIRVDGGGGYCDHIFLHRNDITSVGKDIFIRYYVRFGQALGDGHVTFMSLVDSGDGGKHTRMGGQSKVLIFNRELNDAGLPALSPTGISMSLSPSTNQWICVEVEINQTAQSLTTWVNSAQVQGLTVDTIPTPDIDQQWLAGSAWKPNLQDFNLGWESYGGATNTLWFDDVALSSKRIGCGQ